MADRPAPVVTVSVPGHPGRPDLLDAERPPRTPATRAQRMLVAAACAVLLAGLVVVAGERAEPVPAATPDPAASAPGAAGPRPPSVTARETGAGVVAQAFDPGLATDDLSVRLDLLVSVAGAGGPGDSQSPSVDDEVTLLGVTGLGFVLRLVGVDGPAPLGDVGRQGTSFAFDLEVAVTDCSVPTQAQRRLDLELQRGDGPVTQVRVATTSDVVRRLDRLVSRTCRRPRG